MHPLFSLRGESRTPRWSSCLRRSFYRLSLAFALARRPPLCSARWRLSLASGGCYAKGLALRLVPLCFARGARLARFFVGARGCGVARHKKHVSLFPLPFASDKKAHQPSVLASPFALFGIARTAQRFHFPRAPRRLTLLMSTLPTSFSGAQVLGRVHSEKRLRKWSRHCTPLPRFLCTSSVKPRSP